MFAAVEKLDEEEGNEDSDQLEEEDTDILSKEAVTELKNRKKELRGQITALRKNELKPLKDTLKKIKKLKEEEIKDLGYDRADIEARTSTIEREIELLGRNTEIDKRMESIRLWKMK